MNKDMLMEWYKNILFSDFDRIKEASKILTILILNLESSDDYEEINYTFTFNPLSSLEFGNIYNERCMTPF